MSDSERLSRIENKIDKIVDHISSIDVTLAAQHMSLEEHIKRTNLLEEQIEPLKKHTANVEGVVKFIILIATVGAGVEGLFMILKGFIK